MLVERVDSYETIWIIGDDFVSDSANEFFQLEEGSKTYMNKKFDVKILCSYSSALTKSVTARLHNNIVTGMVDQPLLPKAIIFVLEADMI